MPLILGRLLLATARAEINVQAGTLSFCICGERVDFCFPPPLPTPAPATSTPSPASTPAIPPSVSTSLEVFDGDGEPDIWPSRYDTSASIPTSLGIPSATTGEGVEWSSGVQNFPSVSRRDPTASRGRHQTIIPDRPYIRSSISIEDLETGRNRRRNCRYWCWRGCRGGRCWSR